jgi:hypothetical protein
MLAPMSAITRAGSPLSNRSSSRVSGSSVNAPGNSKMSAIDESSAKATTEAPAVMRSALRRFLTSRGAESAAPASSAAPSMPAPVVRQVVGPPEISLRIAVMTEKTRFFVATTSTPASARRSWSVPRRVKRPTSRAATSSSTSAPAVSFATCRARFWYAGAKPAEVIKSVAASPSAAVNVTA